ncbi:MAG: DUF551 domain-containing protein [Acinetobacter sp.]|uniref:DUF551 domain-containing protein n=1 Tax=Acinetobacter sp. TaxID=472 RepID=UPI00391D7FC1
MKIKEGGVMDIQNFIAEFKKTFVYDLLSMTLKDEQLFEHVVDGDSVLWFKEQTRQMWLMWEKAKAQAVPEWISVEDKLPETEPNTDGVVCAVVCSLGNVYRARYMHDVDIGVDTKYWSEFAVNYNGREYEHYEINAKISHWMPLPDAPQEPAND